MAKRFTENGKWEDAWFRKLPPVSKLFWLFVVDKCDIAGVWEIDWELASFFIGSKVDESILKDFEGRLERINNNGKIWIVKFIEFQYGTLNPAVNVHKAVISLLEKKGLLERVKGCLTLKEGFGKGSGRVQEGFKNPSGRVKDKEKDIVSNIPDKERLPEKEKPTKEKEVCKVEGNPESFEMLWERYPNKDGKKEALRHFCASVKSEKDLADIKRALENYIGSKNVREGYVKSGATWFNNWRDWIDFAGVGKKVAPELVKFDEDTEFLCADCRQVKPKTEREYGEDSRARCKVCHKKYLEEWNRQHANDMKRLEENWQKLSKHAKQYQVEHRQKLGLPILPWMKEEK